jgi:hypothetical protein
MKTTEKQIGTLVPSSIKEFLTMPNKYRNKFLFLIRSYTHKNTLLYKSERN